MTHATSAAQAVRALHPKTAFFVDGDTLRREINDNERLLVQLPKLALAVPVLTLFDAERRGVRFVHLTDQYGREYVALLDAFWRPPAFRVDRGYGAQQALPLEAMFATREEAAGAPVQPGLFEVTP